MGARVEAATVRDADSADAAGIAAIGKESVPETYRDLVDALVLRNIVDQSYSIEALRACMPPQTGLTAALPGPTGRICRRTKSGGARSARPARRGRGAAGAGR